MRYCQQCVLPETRPGLELDADGVCNACRAHQRKPNLDWKERRLRLGRIFEQARQRERGFDCIVPVSGGKDSTWQVVVCKEHGLRVLALTWRTPSRTELGQRNLENLISLGVDHIDYTVDPEVERRFFKAALIETGSIGVPMHFAIYGLPLKTAVAFNIPLVVWGENPYLEYGGSDSDAESDNWDHDPLLRHGILQGTNTSDWIADDLSAKDLEPYYLPDENAYRAAGVKSILLGYYMPWDPEESRRVATEHGFIASESGPKLGLYDYADLDCDFISVHHHFKWFKFGFTRLWDNLALEIRNGRMSRGQAIEEIARRGDQTPHADIDRICQYLDLPLSEFRALEEKLRNPKVWKRDGDTWKIRDFLIPEWDWSGSQLCV
jgi:N-acetyl sugar amidotransferase